MKLTLLNRVVCDCASTGTDEDAYFTEGTWEDTGERLNDAELDALTMEHADVLESLAHERLMAQAEALYDESKGH